MATGPDNDDIKKTFEPLIILGVFWSLFGVVVLVVGIGFAFSWVGAAIAARVRNAEMVGMLSMFWLFPLMLASSAFVPTNQMHELVRMFAEIQPVSVVSDAARARMRANHDCGGVNNSRSGYES